MPQTRQSVGSGLPNSAADRPASQPAGAPECAQPDSAQQRNHRGGADPQSRAAGDRGGDKPAPRLRPVGQPAGQSIRGGRQSRGFRYVAPYPTGHRQLPDPAGSANRSRWPDRDVGSPAANDSEDGITPSRARAPAARPATAPNRRATSGTSVTSASTSNKGLAHGANPLHRHRPRMRCHLAVDPRHHRQPPAKRRAPMHRPACGGLS